MSKSGNLLALSPIFNASESPIVFYAEDPPYLPRILIFYWPVQSVGSFASTSRIRTTILSAAGFKSYAAFSVAPSSSYYSAVHKLPDDKQRDDISRGIAFALCRYFSEVPTEVKNAITDENLKEGIGLKWGQSHAAHITCKMSKVINTDEIIEALLPFQKERPSSTSSTATSSLRPLLSIRKTRPSFMPPDHSGTTRVGNSSTPARRIPSSQSKRTPSGSTPSVRKNAPTPVSTQSADQLESLRFKMCEFVDTEDRYIIRLQELIELVTHQGRTPKSLSSRLTGYKSQKAVNAMLQFPSLLDQIKDLNLAFLDDIETVLQNTEDTALSFLDRNPETIDPSSLTGDPIGIYAFAKVLLNHFPKFPMAYREYLDLHSQVSSNLDQFLKEGTTSIQQAPSLLMEPAQRISRYGLYIDTMMPHIPPTSTIAIRTLEKARRIIAEICEMEPAASTILDSLRIEHEARRRALSPTKFLSGLTKSGPATTEAPALVGSLKERETPRLFPSLGRSLSRRTKSRPNLAGVLSEQDPSQVNNHQRQPTYQPPYAQPHNSQNQIPQQQQQKPPQLQQQHHQPRNDENRPLTSSSGMSLSSPKRPQTSGSAYTTTSSSSKFTGGGGSVRARTPGSPGSASVEHYRTALMRAEDENYKLLQENADLKRMLRECSCGGSVAR